MSAAKKRAKTTPVGRLRRQVYGGAAERAKERAEWEAFEVARDERDTWARAAVAVLESGAESGVAVARANHAADAFALRFAPNKGTPEIVAPGEEPPPSWVIFSHKGNCLRCERCGLFSLPVLDQAGRTPNQAVVAPFLRDHAECLRDSSPAVTS